MTEPPSPPRAPARRPLVLAACMMATFMVAVESTIVGTAIPSIVADLGGFHLFSWTFAAYLLSSAVTVPIYGRLADLYGRKRVFFAGSLLFLAGSTLCGLATSMPVLILFRLLQGLGAGAVQPIAYTIVGDIYTPAERARIQGWLSGTFAVAAVMGPALGAFLVEHGSWPVVFWINLPVGALAIAMLARFLPEHLPARRPRIDYAGSALLMGGAGALLLALVQAEAFDGRTLALLAAGGGAALALLAWHETRTPEPMVPLGLWRHRIIAVGNLGALTMGAAMMGVTVFLPTFVQGAMGRSAGTAGAMLAALSLSWAVASIPAGRLMVAVSYRAAAFAGGALLLAGALLLLTVRPDSGALWAGFGAAVLGTGMGFCNTSYIISVQAGVAWNMRGAATSSVMFMRSIGQALGAGLFGAIVNFALHAQAGVAADGFDRLIDPARRAGLEPGETAAMVGVLTRALDGVFLVTAGLALVALLLPLWMPAGFGPRQQRQPGAGPGTASDTIPQDHPERRPA